MRTSTKIEHNKKIPYEGFDTFVSGTNNLKTVNNYKCAGSQVSRECKYVSGWVDSAKILTKEELLKRLRKR